MHSLRLASVIGWCLVVLACAGVLCAQGTPGSSRGLSLGDRIACQSAIEEVYWRHRIAAGEDGARLSFAEAVPQDVIRVKAENVMLQSRALERFWGVRISGEQLQAELDRMAARSKSPDVLAELFAAAGNDPERAAECLARPLLVDRLIQSYYAGDERFHGALKERAQAELAAGAAQASTGRTEIAWHRGPALGLAAGVVALEPTAFEARAKELKQFLGGPTGNVVIGRVSTLREDSHRFYAVTVKTLNENDIRISVREWPKVSFDSWWGDVRQQLPMDAEATGFNFALPMVAPNGNCRDDSWKPTMQLLDPRYWHTAVWTGSEMIVWGGMMAVGQVFNDGSRYNPATDTWTLVASAGAPKAREAHVAVWTGKEMLVWGGRGDTTGGRYNPVTDTWAPMSTVNAPEFRWYASVVWTGKEMIVWGGDNGGFVLNSGGRYNPTKNKWTPLPAAPLSPRAFHAAAWTGSQMVVWGGYNVYIGQMYADGARYDLASNTWRSVAAANAPNQRFYHTAVWTGSQVVIWGGLNYPVYDLSGGRYDPATDSWTPTSLANAPSLRWFHVAIWTGTEMIVQGGTPGASAGGRYNPATDTWKATSTVNAANNGQGITGVWTGKEMIVWGGFDDVSIFHNDGGRYNPKTDSWLRLSTMNVPQARGLHSGEWTGSEMVIWGGAVCCGGMAAVGGRYDPATDNWRTTSTVGAPITRENATNVWTGTEVIFWGGEPDGNPFTPGSGGRYNPVTDSWKLMSKVNAPYTTYGHSAIWTGTDMIVYGGISSSLNAKRYKLANDTWTDATMVNDPGHRDHHGAVWTGTEMIVWGGSIDNGYVGPEGGRYNPTTNRWTVVKASGLDQLRMWPVAVWTGTEAIFWGGYNQLFGRTFNDGGRYNPANDAWTLTSTAGAPTPRVAQGVWTGKEMLLWGGDNDSSGGRYNPASNSWKNTTQINAPPPLWGGRWSTVWTGNQMVVWGGMGETQQGGLYCASGQANVAPVAVDDAYNVKSAKKTTFGNRVGVLVNDTDFNSDVLAAKIVTKTVHGTITFNANGSFIYKSAKGYLGLDTFTYQANDGLAGSNTATVTITVQ